MRDAMERKFEEMMIEQCAPTLAKIKPASLFVFKSCEPLRLRSIVDKWNDTFKPFDIEILIMKQCPETNTALIYMYHRAWLKKIMARKDIMDFLKSIGYEYSADIVLGLRELSYRLCLQSYFPHEIGIFLGYPLADVKGFIRYKGMNYTCCGFWKSYSEPQIAQRIFALYKRCFETYKALYKSGKSIKQLIAAA